MPTGKFKIVNGATVELEDNEIVTYTAEENAASEARAVQRVWLENRSSGYASITEQLDQLYWDQINGTTAWRDAITANKAATPKP